MKTSRIITLAAIAASLAAVSCAPPPSAPQTTRLQVSSSLNNRDAKLSDSIFHEVNRYRATKSASSMKRHAGLDRLAQGHAEYLRQHRGTFSVHGRNVSHFGFESRARAANHGMGFIYLAENVAAAKNDGASGIVRLWAASKSHELTMRSKYDFTGIGTVIDDDGMVFTVQLFGTRTSSHMAMADRLRGF